jgi:hypothetical protein
MSHLDIRIYGHNLFSFVAAKGTCTHTNIFPATLMQLFQIVQTCYLKMCTGPVFRMCVGPVGRKLQILIRPTICSCRSQFRSSCGHKV